MSSAISFSSIKPKIKNLGDYQTLAEIKREGLRIAYNRADDSYWLIEGEFLCPVIKSPRECKSIVVKPSDLRYKIFMCHKSREELRGTRALAYIQWGEERGFDKRPSCSGRKRWWDVGEQKLALCSYPMINNERLIFCNNKIFNDANLVGIYPKTELGWNLIYSLNSTYNMLNMELLGIANLGEGAIKQNPVYIKRAIIVDPKFVKLDKYEFLDRTIKSIFKECGIDPKSETLIEEQESKPLPDRAELDKIIFDVLGLTEDERKEVYRAVCQLVWNRISKARSV